MSMIVSFDAALNHLRPQIESINRTWASIGEYLDKIQADEFDLVKLEEALSLSAGTLAKYLKVVRGTEKEWRKPERPIGALHKLTQLPAAERPKIVAEIEASPQPDWREATVQKRVLVRKAELSAEKRALIEAERVALNESMGVAPTAPRVSKPAVHRDKQGTAVYLTAEDADKSKVGIVIDDRVFKATLPVNLQNIKITRFRNEVIISADIVDAYDRDSDDTIYG